MLNDESPDYWCLGGGCGEELRADLHYSGVALSCSSSLVLHLYLFIGNVYLFLSFKFKLVIYSYFRKLELRPSVYCKVSGNFECQHFLFTGQGLYGIFVSS